MSRRSSVGRTVIAGSAAQAISIALTLVTTPVLLHALGLTAYGALAVIGSLAGYIGILDLGIGASLGRYMVVYRERGDKRRAAGVSTFALLFYGIMAAILFPLLVTSAPQIGRFLSFPPALNSQLPTLLAILLSAFIIGNLMGLLNARLASIQRLDLAAYGSMAGGMAYAVAVVLIVPRHPNLYAVFACNFAQILVSALFMAAAITKQTGEAPLSFGAVSWSDVPGLFSFGFWTQLSGVTAIVNLEADKAIISSALGVADVAPYQVANRIALLNRLFPLQIISALLPDLTARISRGLTPREVAQLYGDSSRLLMLATMLISGFVAAAADSLLRLWLGIRLPWAAELCAALVMSYVVNNATGVGTTIIKAEGRPQLETAYGMISAVLNVGFTVLLIGRYGLAGVVGGTIAGNVIGSCYFIAAFHKRYRFPWWATMGQWLVKLLVMMTCAGAAAFVLLSVSNGPAVVTRAALLPGLVASGLVYLAVFALCGHLVGFWQEADYRLLGSVTDRFARLRSRAE